MKIWLRIILSIIGAIIAYGLIRCYVTDAYNMAVIEMESSVKTNAIIYTATTCGQFLEKKTSPYINILPEKKVYKFYLKNASIAKLRLDPGLGEGKYTIHSIKLLSFFSPKLEIPLQYPSKDIQKSSNTTIIQKGKSITIESSGADPYIIFNNLPRNKLSLHLWLTILCVAAFTYLISPKLQITEWRFWQDTFYKKPSSGENLDVLDGLRGFAALDIFLIHVGIVIGDNETVGVITFFTLSGFLLALPFTEDCGKILSIKTIATFFQRRINRIFPMFFAYLLIGAFFHHDTGQFVRSMFFLEGENILWTVLEEVHFYILLPPLFAICALVLRNKATLVILLFLSLSILTQHNIIPTGNMYLNGRMQSFMFWIFCSGVMTAFIYRSPIMQTAKVRSFFNNKFTGIILVIALFYSCFIWKFLFGEDGIDKSGWGYDNSYYFTVCFFLLYLVMVRKTNWIYRFFASPFFRILGIISYSFYLLHPICLGIANELLLDLAPHFAKHSIIYPGLSFTITFMISIMTYTVIERPFIKGYKPQPIKYHT